MNSYVKPGQGVDLKDLSHDEVNRLKRAVKKPEFLGLMNDYMMEISDPKNKDEYDQYLEQMAEEGELPKGMKLIRPDPHFCIKTLLIAKQDKSQDQKLFINVCSATVVGMPKCEIIEQDGQSGQSWSLPYSAGKIRYDQDKNGGVCNTIDVTYHPHAIDLTRKMARFHELVCQTSLDAAQKQMGERKEEISKDYKVLKKCKCKGGTPALLTMKLDKEKKKKTESEVRQGGEGKMPKLYNEIMNKKDEYDKDKGKEGEKSKEPVVEVEGEEEPDVEEPEMQLNEFGEKIVQIPKYKFVYSYPVEYADFLDSVKKDQKRPNIVGIDINMPRARSLKEIELQINEQNLILSVKDKYLLEVKLPYAVMNEQGSAKFDQKKKLLRIRCPINKEKMPPLPEMKDVKLTRAELEEVDDGDEKQNESQPQNSFKIEELPDDYKTSGISQNNDNSTLEVSDGRKINLNVFNEQESKKFILGEDMVIDQPYTEEQLAPLIEEVEIEQSIESQQAQVVLEPKVAKVEYVKCEFKTQETTEKFFLIVNISKYSDFNQIIIKNI